MCLFQKAGPEPSPLISCAGGKVRNPFPALLPHRLSLTSKEVSFPLMKPVKDDSCLRAASSLDLMTAFASESKLRRRKNPMWPSEGTDKHMCCAFKIFFVNRSIVARSRHGLDPQKGRAAGKVFSNFPIVCFTIAPVRENSHSSITVGPAGHFCLCLPLYREERDSSSLPCI